jgi:DNA-binding transcriptional LysR family regulator
MARNLDMTSLRSLVAIAELGGVTRAASYLNLTQSAVSMQLKRMEEGLGIALLDRTARTVSLTNAGEQLLGYARQMIALNDEAYARLTDHAYEGSIVLGVPHDIVYPAIPQVLRRFHADFPRVKVQLVSSFTSALIKMFERGECDVILTTEADCGHGGEILTRQKLVWIGAPGGTAYRQRPLRLAFESRCIFRPRVQAALTDAGIPWEMAVDSEQTRTIEASVSADLAVHAILEGTIPPIAEEIEHGGSLPDLGDVGINLYCQPGATKVALAELVAMVRQAFGSTEQAKVA